MQQQIVDMIGWGVAKVKQYSALKGIDQNAWGVVVTTFENIPKLPWQLVVVCCLDKLWP